VKAQAATVTAKHSPIPPMRAVPLISTAPPRAPSTPPGRPRGSRLGEAAAVVAEDILGISPTSPVGSFHSCSRESAGCPVSLRARQWKPPDFPVRGRHEVPATGWPRDTLVSPTPTTAERGDPGAAQEGLPKPSAPGEPCFSSLPYLSVPSRPGGAMCPRYRLGPAQASGVAAQAPRRGRRIRRPTIGRGTCIREARAYPGAKANVTGDAE
jgi:hypothetical protein